METADDARHLYSDIRAHIAVGMKAVRSLRGHANDSIAEITPPVPGKKIGQGNLALVREVIYDGQPAVVKEYGYRDCIREYGTAENAASALARQIWLSADPALLAAGLIPALGFGHCVRTGKRGAERRYFSAYYPRYERDLESVFWSAHADPEYTGLLLRQTALPIVKDFTSAHGAGYVLGDAIKPGNILLKDGAIGWTDAETVRFVSHLTGSQINRQEQPMVTAIYAANALLNGTREFPTQEDDVEAAAIMLSNLAFDLHASTCSRHADYDMLLLERAVFASDSHEERAEELGLPGLDGILVDGVRGRYRTMGEFGEALGRVLI